MSLEMTAPPPGLLSFSADQWSNIRSLAKAVVEESETAEVDGLLRVSQRLGVLPEAQLLADAISDEAYAVKVAGRVRYF
jgi:hypothetical protein